MTTQKSESMERKEIDLSVNVAGIRFPNPIGVGAIGEHWGHAGSLRDYVDLNSDIFMKHVKAGAGYFIMAGAHLTPATERIIAERTSVVETPLRRRSDKIGHRMLKIEGKDPYGLEGFYFVPSPFYLDKNFARFAKDRFSYMMEAIHKKKPKDVPIVINLGGFADIEETWVDGAKWFQELGADMIEVNLGCPLPSGLDGTLQGYYSKRYSPLCQGLLMGDNPEKVYSITKAVVDAVSIPVGVKLTPETGFPRVIDVARAADLAGAQFVQLFNAAVGMAPPDIYNEGKPKWLFMDGSPFCMASGSFLRVPCYKSVAAVKRFVPNLDIAAAGGLVEPEHFIEAMMLGASLVQPCTGIIEQGNSLIRKGVNFMKRFVAEQGYDSLSQVIGLGQKFIKYNQDIDMMAGKTRIYIDHEKCTKCQRCVDNICQALSFEEGRVRVDLERCVGCGGCVLACRHDALKVGLREGVPLPQF